MSKFLRSLFQLLIIFTLSITCFVHGEPELETVLELEYGGQNNDRAYSAIEYGDGFLLVGYTMSYGAGDSDVWLLKIDQEGIPIWNKTYGTAQLEQGLYLVPTYDNNILIAGRTNNGENNLDLLLLKITPNGDYLWNKTMGGRGDDWMWEIKKTIDNNYVLIGRTNSYGAGLNDYWFMKINDNGDVLWNTTLGGVEDERGRTVHPLENGDLLVLGWSGTYTQGGLDFWLVETDEDGEILWDNCYGGFEADRGSAIGVIDDGFVLAGSTNSFSESGSDAYFMGLDSNREMVWNKTYGGEGLDTFHDIISLEDDEYLLIGGTDSFGFGGRDFYIVLTDGFGNLIQEITYGGPEDDQCFFSLLTKDGDVLLGGHTNVNGSEDWLVYRIRRVLDVPEPLLANLVYQGLLVEPMELELGAPCSVSVSVENTGELVGTDSIELYVNDVFVEKRMISVDGGEVVTEVFTFIPDSSGQVEVKIGSLLEYVTVNALESEEPSFSNRIPGFDLLSFIVVLCIIPWITSDKCAR